MVFKKYVEQLFLDGLQRNVQAYSRIFDLIPSEKPRRAFQFQKGRHFTYLCCRPQSPPREIVTWPVIFVDKSRRDLPTMT